MPVSFEENFAKIKIHIFFRTACLLSKCSVSARSHAFISHCRDTPSSCCLSGCNVQGAKMIVGVQVVEEGEARD